ncbi:hypothetical protein AJ87_01180 [Rhizobium yanglingense]|nr:hypothetical protein AJ87_01180 [Rhizobium yanglingense]
MRRNGLRGTLLSRLSAATDAGSTAQAARKGAPQAPQVADRFHLMQNLRVAIEEQMSLTGRATGRALLPDKDIGNTQVDLIQDDADLDAKLRRKIRR